VVDGVGAPTVGDAVTVTVADAVADRDALAVADGRADGDDDADEDGCAVPVCVGAGAACVGVSDGVIDAAGDGVTRGRCASPEPQAEIVSVTAPTQAIHGVARSTWRTPHTTAP
jgi:hypothetical protein